jgi:soluble lytic murein transglycosylase
MSGNAPTAARVKATALACIIVLALTAVAAAQTPTAPADATPHDEGGLTFDAVTTVQKSDLAAVKQAIELARRHKSQEAGAVQQRIGDPVARKVAEWAILRSDNGTLNSSRYRDFIAANPSWPSQILLRRKLEALLWQEHAGLDAVRAVTGDRPQSGMGKFALGRALMEQGDRGAAAAVIRDAWRSEPLTWEAEEQMLQVFGDLISRDDEKARMGVRLYAGDDETAERAAHRLGGDAPAVATMRVAFAQKAANAHDMLKALPASVKDDPLVIFSRIQALHRTNKITEAAALLAAAPRDLAAILDADKWWMERRAVARRLLDLHDAKTAYKVVRDAVTPLKEDYRVEQEFMAGWIALRLLKNPGLAAEHFARIGQGVTNPVFLARAGYWRGRAAEAAGHAGEAHGYYETAARYGTAYYGQLARAKLGFTGDIPLAPLPLPPPAERAALAKIEVVRAADILYAIGARDLVVLIMDDLGKRATDTAMLAALAELAAHNGDAHAMLLVGKAALARGYAFDRYAFPTFGLPEYKPVAPEVDNAVVYAIARQESAFDAHAKSEQGAVGLMQVIPKTAEDIAKKFKISYGEKGLETDVFNVQVGAAVLHENIANFHGSFILAFASYNKGPPGVREWIKKNGDPLARGADPVDWVERIPNEQTRYYVQHIVENLEVYRALFGGGKLQIEADLHRGAATN